MKRKRLITGVLCLAILLLVACSGASSQPQSSNNDPKTPADVAEEQSANPINEFNTWLRGQVDTLIDEGKQSLKEGNASEEEVQLMEDMREDLYKGLVKKHLVNASDEEFREAWEAELYIQMIRHSAPPSHPNTKYKDAFENFFGDYKWVSFEGKKDNSDELIRIVEFTGDCVYANNPADALIQFEISDAGFEPTYMSINDNPKSKFELTALINKVFEDYELNANKVNPVN